MGKYIVYGIIVTLLLGVYGSCSSGPAAQSSRSSVPSNVPTYDANSDYTFSGLPKDERLDALWAASDWDGVIRIIRNSPTMTSLDKLTGAMRDKLYAAYLSKADAQALNGKFNDAYDTYQKAVEVNPSRTEARMHMIINREACESALKRWAVGGGALFELSCPFSR